MFSLHPNVAENITVHLQTMDSIVAALEKIDVSFHGFLVFTLIFPYMLLGLAVKL